MRFVRLRHFVLWLGLLALTASGIAQNQLSINVLTAAIGGHAHDAAGGHVMPDGTFMAGSMDVSTSGGKSQPDATGHTHKGHADCSMCGAVAAMTSVSVPVANTFIVPAAFAFSHAQAAVDVISTRALYAPYASRAPPSLHG